jgi:hypothetical protein
VQQSYNNPLALAIKVIYKTAKIINYFVPGDSVMMRSLQNAPALCTVLVGGGFLAKGKINE